MNKADSERIASYLKSKGYKPASKKEGADFIVVNMCSVRQSAVDRVYGKIKDFAKLKAQKPKLKTILTGCVLKKDKPKFAKGFDQILKFKDLLRYQPKHKYNPIAYIPISNGCNNACTYCVVPYTRGPLVCRGYNEILNEVKNMVKKGFKEIWLLGQNVNDYHDKIKNQKSPKQSLRDATGQTKIKNSLQKSKIINFAKLIKTVNDIHGDFKFFFTSPHPKPSTGAKLGAGLVPHSPDEVGTGAGNFSWDELIDTLAHCNKFGKYINLPVQSGDDKILKKMKRNYTIKEYKNLVKKIRKKIPEIKLSTDVIVGFPGETKKQFQNTVKLFKEIKFDWAYIAKYSPRVGTVAFQLKDDVPLGEKKRREKILRNILKENLIPHFSRS